MSDPDSKKGDIPSWQKQSAEGGGTVSETETEKENERIEQAKQFLQADEVRTSSPSKQVDFLRGKGYSEDEIGKLLGTMRKNEVPTQEQTSNPENVSSTPRQKTILPSSSSNQQTESHPPIVTYPEFLAKPIAPSPLITSHRLLTTLTLFSSLYLLAHGTHRYLLAPMQEFLTQSRHSLLSLASHRLSALNEKLREAVSAQPVPDATEHGERDDEESDGDPTEMFHRDVGIQTSPSLLNSESPRPSSPMPSRTKSGLELHLDRLSVLSSHLHELNHRSQSEGTDAADLSTAMDSLREYLEDLAFTPPTYSFGSQGYSGLVRDMVGGEGTNEEPDEIVKLKASIRSVKGVLLSARTFPRGGVGTAYT